MSYDYARIPGPGDEATWMPYSGHPLDPRAPLDDDAYWDAPSTGIDDAWDRAQSIAHDPAALDELQADGPLDYSKVYIKIDGQQVDLFGAADLLRLRIMAGRHAEADCIARDMTDALAQEIADMLISGRL